MRFLAAPFRAVSPLFRVLAAAIVLVAATAPDAEAAKQPYAGIVMDARTGKVLYEHRADARSYPASLTKMMTLYMVFERLENGSLSKNTQMRVSANAASRQPSKLYLKAGSTITVENAIKALVTKSANDVATTVAEHIGGSESKFADMMTAKAKQLGMKGTRFRNASGLPNSSQVTTARDMARLGIALREHFPRYYSYFSTRSFTYAGKRYGNHNRLLGSVRGVDGIKTGYTRASGFNLVSSVEDNGRSIVAVVLGGRTSASRNAQMRKLISQYLGRASKSGGGDLIAKGPSSGNGRTVYASLPTNDAPVPTAAPRTIQATAAPVMAYAAPSPAPSRPVAAIDKTMTASIPDGWMIQVAALGSRSEAEDKLDNIKSRAGSILSDAKPVVIQFEKAGTVYHRARFAGFSSKNDAWSACKALQQKRIDCYAVSG